MMVAVVGGVASSFEAWLSFGNCEEDYDDGIGDIVGDDGDYGEKKNRGHGNVYADDIGFFSHQVLMLALLVLWWWL